MIIRGLKANNFMRFGSFELDELPEAGLIGIFGENESGKSTLGDLISFCLFGRSTRAPEGKAERLVRWGQDDCTAEMEFSVGKHIYRVYRRISSDGTVEGSLVSITDNGKIITSSVAEIPSSVEEILGFGFKEFRYSTFIAQNELDIILRSADDRKIVLNSMLGVGFMEKMGRKIAAKRTDREKEIVIVKKRLEDKNEVLQVYTAREDDMNRVMKRLDRNNEKLLRASREREQLESTVKLLEEVRRKGEIFKELDQRISRRREELKQVEAECSSLLRQVDRIPKIEDEIRDKQKEIGNIRNEKIDIINQNFTKIEKYKVLQKKLGELEEKITEKEAEISELNNRLDQIEKSENRIRELRSEIEVLNAFIESYGGPDKFKTTASYLAKDIKLLESELGKVRISHEKDLQMIADRKEAYAAQKDRVRRQIEAATVQEVDREKLDRVQAAERKVALGKDISLVLAAVFLMGGVVPTLLMVNYEFLLIWLGVVPSLGAATIFLSKLRQINQSHQQLQQQLYAFNISQRGVLELQESLDEVDDKLAGAEIDLSNIENVYSQLEHFRIDCFEGLEESVKNIENKGIEELKGAAGIGRDIIDTYSEFRSLINDDRQPFSGLTTFNPDSVVAGKMDKRVRLEEELETKKEEVEPKPEFINRKNTIESEISGLKNEADTLQKEMTGLGVTADDLPGLEKEREQLESEALGLEREIQECKSEIGRLEKLGAQAAVLEERRKNIIDEIDEDLIKHYELKEATYDIDYSDDKFEELRRRDTQLEADIEEYREAIRDLDSERKTIQKDLDRIPAVKSELDEIRSDKSGREAQIMKFRLMEDLFRKTGMNIRKRLVPQIEAYFGWILPKMTRGRYHRVRLDDSFEIKVFSDEYGDYVNLDVLSGGTVDQLLISLRLAFARATCTGTGNKSPFLFLDEPFSSFDESRREQFFNLLRILRGNFQQIFLISHLPNLEDFVDYYIRLDIEKRQSPSYTSWNS